MKYKFVGVVVYSLLVASWLSLAHAEVIFQDDFEDHTNDISGWNTGTNVYLDSNCGATNGKCAKIEYTGAGTGPYWFSKNISSKNLDEIYVRFMFKVENPSGGAKFLKLFGKKDSPKGYANTTFALNYNSNKLEKISYGPGSTTVNDTQAVINYSGSSTVGEVNVLHDTGSFNPSDNQWYSFEAHMKYNDDGVSNGIYRVWIDGELRVHATNVKNRHDNNSKHFQSVDLANYSNSNQEHDWKLWYDDVVISTEPIGGGEPIETVALPESPPGFTSNIVAP